MGFAIPYMATDFDTPFDDGSLCLGLVSRRALKKVDQSSPRHWAGNIRPGCLSILLGLVGSPQGEDEEESV